jgi:hypothetical protein
MSTPVAADQVDVFEFLAVRAPYAVDQAVLRRAYIHDDFLAPALGVHTHVAPDLRSIEHMSPIGKLVYDKVFCNRIQPLSAAWRDLRAALLKLIGPRVAACPSEETEERTTAGSSNGLLLRDLERHPYITDNGAFYILPDRLEQVLAIALVPELIQVLPILEAERAKFDPARLVKRLETVFSNRTLDKVVFDKGGHAPDFAQAKRGLFDMLYVLYMLRRWTTVSLEHVIAGLRGLHVLEALAIDRLYTRARAGQLDAAGRAVITALGEPFPVLRNWDLKTEVPGFPLIKDQTALDAYLEATPIIHPIFARVFWYTKPFNDIKPIGVGDLKVVKHWLRGYKVGEISHIANVLQSEAHSRTHRALEKTEEVFAYTADEQQESVRDTQTTDRFEMRRETDRVLKTDLSANANLNVNVNYQGTGYSVVSTVSGGFAYNRSQTEQEKVFNSFARDVVDKAVSRVQSRVSRQRTTTKLFESEERNSHSFDNKTGQGHISGLYHWLDKEYWARLFNYGKRMMFEFTVPEPAAFLVESRLRAHETELEVPQPPEPPVEVALPQSVTSLAPSSIDEKKFNELRREYDLSEFSFPMLTKTVEFVNSATGNNYFTATGITQGRWEGRNYTCRLGAKDYRIKKLRVHGYVYFWGRVGAGEGADAPAWEINTMEVWVDGQRLMREVNNNVERWTFDGTEYAAGAALPFDSDQVSVFLGFWDVTQFDLSFHAELELSPAVLADWQHKVYAKVKAAEQKKVDAINADLRQTYQAELSSYRAQLAELRATAINDLLQGQSEAYNRQLIVRELKRACLAMLTKEFDADASDDTLTQLETVGERAVPSEHRRLTVEELPDSSRPTSATAEFETVVTTVDFPVPDLPPARFKGRYVQFLEQAFEWQQLSYVCYPYFWATPPRWIQLISRSDDADPFLTAFLQAGYAKILLAVTPAYDNAVLHYLATGEPWEGGPAPVIGDPLFIPLHEELRKQQDDLANAKPEGKPWKFTLPTSLVYLQNSSTPLPPLNDPA